MPSGDEKQQPLDDFGRMMQEMMKDPKFVTAWEAMQYEHEGDIKFIDFGIRHRAIRDRMPFFIMSLAYKLWMLWWMHIRKRESGVEDDDGI